MSFALHNQWRPSLCLPRVFAYALLGLLILSPFFADTRVLKAGSPEAPAGMVRVKGGRFQMGDVFHDNEWRNEKPVHRVKLGDFYLAKNELSVREWRAYLKAKGKQMPDTPPWGWHDDHPIMRVSWFEAVAYCNWRSAKEGLRPVYRINGQNVSANWNANGYRLPTEAEWEYAARSRGQHHTFGNGQNIADPRQINFDGSKRSHKPYSVVGEHRKKTTPVGTFGANELGLYDMSGNVFEWVWDWFGNYPSASQSNPRGPEQGKYRVLRGGSWANDPRLIRAAVRNYLAPDGRDVIYYIGFRLARSTRRQR